MMKPTRRESGELGNMCRDYSIYLVLISAFNGQYLVFAKHEREQSSACVIPAVYIGSFQKCLLLLFFLSTLPKY